MPIGKVNNTEHDVKYLAPKTGLVKTLRPPEETVSPSTPFAIVPMTYNGGGILAAPEIVALYWGNFAASDIDAMQAWFAGWAGYIGNAIAPAGLDQVLLQYGVYSASVGVYYNDVAAPANATDTDVMNEVIALQGAGNLPAFADNRIFVVMTKGIIFSGYGTVWCAYHGKWAANSYCNLPVPHCRRLRTNPHGFGKSPVCRVSRNSGGSHRSHPRHWMGRGTGRRGRRLQSTDGEYAVRRPSAVRG